MPKKVPSRPMFAYLLPNTFQGQCSLVRTWRDLSQNPANFSTGEVELEVEDEADDEGTQYVEPLLGEELMLLMAERRSVLLRVRRAAVRVVCEEDVRSDWSD
eukprot:767039-Hanusia_phi.AAC.3